MALKFLTARPFYAVFEGEGGGDGGGAGGAGGSGSGTPPATFTQEQVNAFMKKEKEKYTQQQAKMAQQLEELGNKAKLTDEQRQSLEQQIEELRTSGQSEVEKAKRQADKLKSEYDGKLTKAEQDAQTWRSRHDSLQIGYEINGAALRHKVLPQAIPFVESYLKPNTRLVENVDDEGKPTGTFAAKIKLASKDKEGKPVVLDFTVEEALKTMKDDPDTFGHLFEGAKGGTGASSGSPATKKGKLPTNTADYMELRKKDPNAIYQQGR